MLFADNMYEINMHACIHLQWCFSWLTRPCFHLWFIPLPFAWINRPLYLLGDPSSYVPGANIYPLSSLVSYQLFSPCCLARPEDTPQIKLYIHIDDITSSAVPSDTDTPNKKGMQYARRSVQNKIKILRTGHACVHKDASTQSAFSTKRSIKKIIWYCQRQQKQKGFFSVMFAITVEGGLRK